LIVFEQLEDVEPGAGEASLIASEASLIASP
jgi:hypothetical protein